jgi:hypothetical protein
MQARQIAIVAAAVVGAFVLAFGLGKATSGGGTEEAEAGPAKKAQVIQAGEVAVSANAATASLPALKVVKKKKPKQETVVATAPSTTTTTAPSTTTTAPSTQTFTPSTTTQTAPQTQSQPQQQSSGPVSTGGGED